MKKLIALSAISSFLIAGAPAFAQTTDSYSGTGSATVSPSSGAPSAQAEKGSLQKAKRTKKMGLKDRLSEKKAEAAPSASTESVAPAASKQPAPKANMAKGKKKGLLKRSAEKAPAAK